MKRIISSALIVLFAAACAHQTQTPPQLTEEQRTKMHEEALAMASERLKSIAEDARARGDAHVQYLATDLFLKGNMSLMDGDFVTASVLFEHLTALTDDPFVAKKYAVALIRLGELEKAEKVLSDLYKKSGSKDEQLGLILAGLYSGMERHEEAQNIYRALLTADAKNEDACLYLGKAYIAEKKVQLARNLYKTCDERHSKKGLFSYQLGKMAVDEGDLKSALTYFKRAHEKQPGYTQATAALGAIMEQNNGLNAAVVLYKTHLAAKPQDSVILGRLVQAMFSLERYAEVIPYAETMVDLDPEDLNLKVKLGILYTDSRDYDKAVSVFKELLAVAPDSDRILYYLGAIYQEEKKYEDSIEYFTRIPASSGLYADSSVQIASMLSSLAQNEYVQGLHDGPWKKQFLQKVATSLTAFPDMQTEYAVIKASYFEAVEQFEVAVDTLMPFQQTESFSVQHKYFLAALLERVKRYSESDQLMEEIIGKDPKNAHAWNFIGYSILERGGDMGKAYEYITKAVELQPEDGYIRDSLGWWHFKNGNVQKALKEISFAYTKAPNDVSITKHMALIHKSLRNFKKARGYLQDALKNAKLTSDKKEIHSVIEVLDAERVPASDKTVD